MINFKYIHINNYKYIAKIPLHIHNCYEIVYFHSGSGESSFLNIENYEFESGKYIKYYDSNVSLNSVIKFSPGSFIIYSPFVLHNENHFDASRITAIGFTLDKEDGFTLENKLYNDFDSLIYNFIKQIENEYCNRSFYYTKMIESLIFQMLTQLQRSYDNSQSNSILFAKAYIDQYYMTNINLDKLAKQSGYCTDYFRIQYKEIAGSSPKAYILQKRLNLAIQQISTSDLSLNNIATNCGFSEYNQFVAFFKKHIGVSPSEYRKTLKNK